MLPDCFREHATLLPCSGPVLSTVLAALPLGPSGNICPLKGILCLVLNELGTCDLSCRCWMRVDLEAIQEKEQMAASDRRCKLDDD